MEQTRNFTADPVQIWAISDGRAGNARQAEALAVALAGDGPVDCLVLTPRAPWRWLAPRRLPGSDHAFGAAFAALLAAPPSLVVGCGRQAALATRLLRTAGVQTVQILDPRLDPAHWDLVVVPQHDALRGTNVITSLGGLHPVDDAWLAHARCEFASFAALPGPRTALLLGGNSKHARFDVSEFERLADRLDRVLAREGGSVLATTSRRSPDALRAALKRRYGHADNITWCDAGDGINPYPGLLACADRIICSPDSVNMVTEACATRAPVFVFEPDSTEGGPRRFLDGLLAQGRIRPMDDVLAPYDAVPLHETARVAHEVATRLSALNRRAAPG